MSKKTQFHGILAVGRTQADAVNNYRLLSMGKGAAVQVDGEREIAFVTHASSAADMFNPLTGNMDLETDASMLENLEFQSNSSDDVEVNHLVCESGCGCHVVCDSDSLVKYCPNCTSSLSSEDEDEDMDDDSGLDEDDAGEFEADSSDDELELDADDEDLEAGDSDDLGSDGDDLETVEDSDLESESSDDEPLVVAASSFQEAIELFNENKIGVSESGTHEAHYVVCSNSAECGAHIVSEEEQTECPACHSSVEEPAETPDAESSEDEDLDIDLEDEGVEEIAESADDEDLDPEEDDGDDESDEDEAGNTLNPISEDEELDVKTDEINAASIVAHDAAVEDLDVSYSSNVAGQAVWTAFYKGTPIAMASKSSADKNADIFDSPAFGHAALATAKVAGVQKALAELGFQPIKHKVSVSNEVQRMVDHQVAEVKAALASEQAEYRQKFEAALATAAIGINRGFFADVKNPIKAALWNAMSSAGIRNPESLIDNAFRTHSDAYHKVLFAQANDIAAKPNDVQESLAKTILGTAYQAVSSTQTDGSIEDRLSGLGTSVSSAEEKTAPAPSSAAPDMQMIHRAVASLGRRAR